MNRRYKEVELSKKEADWVEWFELGSNCWWEAFHKNKNRTSRNNSLLLPKTWFNKVLKGLKGKGLFERVPFAFLSENGLHWTHPLFENDGYRVEVGSESNIELLSNNNPII